MLPFPKITPLPNDISILHTRSFAYGVLPYTAIPGTIAQDQFGHRIEPGTGLRRATDRETRGTGFPPTTSMPWHNNGTACLAGSAACLPKLRCVDNDLPRRGSHCFYLASWAHAELYTDSRSRLAEALGLRDGAQVGAIDEIMVREAAASDMAHLMQ